MSIAVATLAQAPVFWLHFLSLWKGVSTRDLLTTTADILIVFYVVYHVLRLVRGTRAAQTLVGVALLGALFYVAKRLDLFTVSWLFEKLIDSFIIFFVVIFQQDIRRVLMQVGQNLFMRRQYEESYVIDEVVSAAQDLARGHIGALIVLERDADLSEHLGGAGVELDARVSKELLSTLFVPDAKNHMHDGAVLIRNLRIQRAGAVLPLSDNADLDQELGTRHRAALGITEETDAVVVVVSEERGEIALCFNGNIVRAVEAVALKKTLHGLFQKKKKKAKSTATPLRSPASSPGLPETVGDARSGRSRSIPAELMALFTTMPMQRPSVDATAPPIDPLRRSTPPTTAVDPHTAKTAEFPVPSAETSPIRSNPEVSSAQVLAVSPSVVTQPPDGTPPDAGDGP